MLKIAQIHDLIGVPKGIRTPVAAVKGRCPRPLDDGDAGGARRDRTADLYNAIVALSQLSYGPITHGSAHYRRPRPAPQPRQRIILPKRSAGPPRPYPDPARTGTDASAH